MKSDAGRAAAGVSPSTGRGRHQQLAHFLAEAILDHALKDAAAIGRCVTSLTAASSTATVPVTAMPSA